jgi:hypothetical protein
VATVEMGVGSIRGDLHHEHKHKHKHKHKHSMPKPVELGGASRSLTGSMGYKQLERRGPSPNYCRDSLANGGIDPKQARIATRAHAFVLCQPNNGEKRRPGTTMDLARQLGRKASAIHNK